MLQELSEVNGRRFHASFPIVPMGEHTLNFHSRDDDLRLDVCGIKVLEVRYQITPLLGNRHLHTQVIPKDRISMDVHWSGI